MDVLRITHKDKVLFPGSGITKEELVRYYEKISNFILPYLKDRPLTMHRFPSGIDKKGFFQKNASDYFPDWIRTTKVKKKGGWVNHVICDTRETLVFLVNQGVITFHIPLSIVDNLEYPDKLIFDLDPPDDNFRLVVKAAKVLRNFLENDLGLTTYVMTTGSKGLHIVVPLKATENFEETHDLAKKIAHYLADQNPKEFTTDLRKDQRKGRLFIDYLRNSYAQTAVSPFSIRALEGAPVATPLHWDELDALGLDSQAYNINSIFQRLEQIDNPWQDFKQHSKRISSAKNKLKNMGDVWSSNSETSKST